VKLQKRVGSGTPDRTLDQGAVRERLKLLIAGRFGGNRRALSQALRAAGIKPDTFSKKLRGERGLTAADLLQVAMAFAENSDWLATGRGLHGAAWVRCHWESVARSRKSSPAEPLENDLRIAAGWRDYKKGPHSYNPVTGDARPGRPRKHKLVLGERITQEQQLAAPELAELKQQLSTEHVPQRRIPRTLILLDRYSDAELRRPRPRPEVLAYLLKVAEHLQKSPSRRIEQPACEIAQDLRAVLAERTGPSRA
jgi:hypothetical protein